MGSPSPHPEQMLAFLFLCKATFSRSSCGILAPSFPDPSPVPSNPWVKFPPLQCAPERARTGRQWTSPPPVLMADSSRASQWNRAGGGHGRLSARLLSPPGHLTARLDSKPPAPQLPLPTYRMSLNTRKWTYVRISEILQLPGWLHFRAVQVKILKTVKQKWDACCRRAL